ncbi:MAG: class I SAM-dependent methyltransferase [Phycisphaeraceae bacterium]
MSQQHPIRLAVCAAPPHEVPLQQRADALADSLSITKTKLGEPDCDLLLAVTSERIELRVLIGEADLIGGHAVCADLNAIDTTSPAGRKIDMPLLKAVGIKKGHGYRPAVIDCTAGLGEDAWLLAAHGCTVTAIERQPVIAALFCDALDRAAKQQPDITQRITPHNANAVDWLPQASSLKPQAIILDPMFPTGRKAKERKPMRVLRMLAGDDDDAPALLAAALATGVHRVCVKRPRHAPVIENTQRPKPDVVYKGKAVRFDVYLNV